MTSPQHTARLRGAVVVAPNFLFQFITRGAARRVSCLVPRTVRSLSGWLVLPVLSTYTLLCLLPLGLLDLSLLAVSTASILQTELFLFFRKNWISLFGAEN